MRYLYKRLLNRKSTSIFGGIVAIGIGIFTFNTIEASNNENKSPILSLNSLSLGISRKLNRACLPPRTETKFFKQNSTSPLIVGDRDCYDSSSNVGELTGDREPNSIIDNWLAPTIQVPELEPWAQIHPNARLAKVPVMMYHDILPKKEVFFDVTPQELEANFQLIQSQGLTPISMDWLIAHLRTGIPLPEKPILLTFDDGYSGHYKYVYPLLKKYGYPAVFSIYTDKIDSKTGRAGITSAQLQEMAADPLVTIAAHSVTHPDDLRELPDDRLRQEISESKRILESKLGIAIRYFTYPAGKHDERVKSWVTAAGYRAAFAMDDLDEHFAGESPDLLSIGRFGQSRLEEIVSQSWGGKPLPRNDGGFNFNTPIAKQKYTVDGTSLILIAGGKPHTIHADSRYQVPEIIQGTEALAAVDGVFFSLKYLDSNIAIGPVLSQNRGFIPGNDSENRKLQGRPLVIITSKWVDFIPFDPDRHNTLAGVASEAIDGEVITDAFVAAAWLVKDNRPQSAKTFRSLYDFDAARHRAFWGIDRAGQAVIGVSETPVDSVSLGKILHQLGLRDAVMLDSGASTSLAYQGESLVSYTPRPVPHVVALFPSSSPMPVPTSHLGLPCVLDANYCTPTGNSN